MLVAILTSIITIPVFIVIYKFIPAIILPIGDGFQIDHILLFLLLFSGIYFLVNKFKFFFLIFTSVFLIGLTITNFSGIYTLKDLYVDYEKMLVGLSSGAVEKEISIIKSKKSKEEQMIEAMNYKNEKVRNFATNIALKHFQDDANYSNNKKWVQFFSVFKEIYGRWKYVYDPIYEDYYATAEESIEQLKSDSLFKGDCDDYSILMAASIKAIGGEVRLVKTRIENEFGTIAHIYPEVKMGKEEDISHFVYLIKSIYFIEESRNKKIHYYIDPKGFVWLNFDYNDKYPGGKYQSDARVNEIQV